MDYKTGCAKVLSNGPSVVLCACGFVSPPGMRFCGRCGGSLGRACRHCPGVSPPDFLYCGHCGQALVAGVVERGAAPAERRPLTVMFCDLVDSTRLSGELEAEELRELVLSYQELCAQAIERREGYVSQYLGDGILAYFGYPYSDEHSVARAVAAGLELQAAVERFNRTAALPIGVRVGLHTGWVVMGEVGGGQRRERLALGETPNVAARIQGLAPVGGVAASGDTQRLAKGLALVREANAERAARGALNLSSMWLTCQAELEIRAGRAGEALELVDYGVKEERFYRSEALRVRGEALRALGRPQEAQEALREALEVSRALAAPGLELRVALSQGDVAGVLSRFEGQDSPELRRARAKGAG